MWGRPSPWWQQLCTARVVWTPAQCRVQTGPAGSVIHCKQTGYLLSLFSWQLCCWNTSRIEHVGGNWASPYLITACQCILLVNSWWLWMIVWDCAQGSPTHPALPLGMGCAATSLIHFNTLTGLNRIEMSIKKILSNQQLFIVDWLCIRGNGPKQDPHIKLNWLVETGHFLCSKDYAQYITCIISFRTHNTKHWVSFTVEKLRFRFLKGH